MSEVIFRKDINTYTSKQCAIAAVEINGFSPDKIVNIVSNANDIRENSDIYPVSIKLDKVSSDFPITYYETGTYYLNYLVSDKLSSIGSPLFYSYELQFDAYGLTSNDIIQVYKNNEELVDPSSYNLEFGDVTLESKYSIVTGVASGYDRYGQSVIWGNYKVSVDGVYRIRILLPIDVCSVNDFYTVRYTKNFSHTLTNNHIELIELNPLYTQEVDNSKDYYIDSGSVKLGTSSKLSSSSTFIYIIKDPRSQIKPLGIFSLRSHNESNMSWNLRLSTGSFITAGKIDNTEQGYYSVGYVSNVAEDPNITNSPITNIIPELRARNVLKVEETPIYIDTSVFKFPYYTISLLDKNGNSLIVPAGTFSLDINGTQTTSISITSLDRYKGYILLDTLLNPEDDISISYYVDQTGQINIANLELNPRIVSDFGLGSSKTFGWNTIGIALRKWDTAVSTFPQLYNNPYFYDYNHPETGFYLSTTVSNSSDMFVASGVLGTDFTAICRLSLNRLTPDILKITDARSIGGGTNSSYIPNLNNSQTNSYTNIGYYDGESLPTSSLLVVHLPRSTYDDLVTKWRDSSMFSPEMYTDITADEYAEFIIVNPASSGYYESELNSGSKTYNNVLDEWSKKEASLYLDQIIRKYIPAGSQYILLDENFSQIRLDI